jgi:hypothetical protein
MLIRFFLTEEIQVPSRQLPGKHNNSMTDIHTQFIDTSQLRIGMFVYLDMGWMEHPFPVSNFRISHQEQIDKIRSLGLERIRYAPAKSDPEPAAVITSGTPEPVQPENPAARARASAASCWLHKPPASSIVKNNSVTPHKLSAAFMNKCMHSPVPHGNWQRA